MSMQEPQETQVQSLGRDDPLEEETTTHSSILGESQGQGSLTGYATGCQRVEHVT